MSAIGAPPLDYRRFLSDAGSGLVALVSLAIVTGICGNNKECHFEFVKTLYEYFRPIFSPLENNTEIGGAVIIITIILFISLMLGFIVNALSYLLLDNLINQIADNTCFQKMLRRLGSVSYCGIAEFSDHFDSINYHFSPKNQLSNHKNKKYAKCIGEIKTRVSIERPDSFRDWGEVEGGRIMFRNFIFIILFCLFFIFLSFWGAHDTISRFILILIVISFAIPLALKLPNSDGLCSTQNRKLLLDRSYIFKYISLAFLTPLLIRSLPGVCDPSGVAGLSTHGLEIIGIGIISINILFFLSAFALTYYHYHIFIAAMYISSGKRWS